MHVYTILNNNQLLRNDIGFRIYWFVLVEHVIHPHIQMFINIDIIDLKLQFDEIEPKRFNEVLSL